MGQISKRLEGKHIIFRADGGFERGIGHLMRCLAFAEAVIDIGGEASLATCGLPEAIERQYRARGIGVVPLGATGAKTQLQTLKADCLVFDSYDIDAQDRALLAQSAKKSAVIDDSYGNGPYQEDLLINPNPGADIAHYTALPRDQLQAVGADYVLLRHDILKAKQARTQSGAGNILISCGGSDPAGAAVKVISCLEAYDDARLHIKVLVGPASNRAAMIGADILKVHQIEFVEPSDDIQTLYNWADAVILAAGTSQWEAAYLGCPFIALMIADNQVPGATFFEEKGGSIALDWRKRQNEDVFLKHFASLLNNEASRKSMAATAQGLIDGNGTARLAQFLAQIV